MAWHIPKEKMHNQPLMEEEVRRRYDSKGFKIINYCYKNNATKMNCYDNEGYRVKVSLSSLSKNTKQYARFSPSCNEENFMFNVKRYYELNPELSKPLDWEYRYFGQHKKHIYLKCICPECGEEYWTDFTTWKNKTKIICNKCTAFISGYERKVSQWLDENKIYYVQQKRYEDCKDKKPLPFDFYLPDYNMCIEVDGEQHYYAKAEVKRHRFSKTEFEKIKNHDAIKTQYCKSRGIALIRIDYTQFRTEKYKQTLVRKIITDKI